MAISKDSTMAQNNLFNAYTISYQGQSFLLDDLRQGYDSLQIRFWRQQGLYGHRKLFILKQSGGNWSAHAYDLRLDSNYLNGNGSREFLTGAAPYYVYQSKQVEPAMGWQPFMDSLHALQILTLPNSKDITGMEVKWTHPNGYYVEFATKNHYRFYQYFDPQRFADSFWQADKMLKIEGLIQTHSGD
jgi:hypothetical protein